MPEPDPPAINQSRAGEPWRRRADALVRRVNLGWCLDQIALALPLAAALAVAGVLYLRATAAPVVWVYVAAIVPILAAILFAWSRARGRFIDRRQALVRLESALHLDTALSSAAQGIASWPVAELKSRPVLRWRWQRSFAPLLLSILLVSVAVLWPLPPTLHAIGSDAPKPRNVQALERVLEQLKEEPLVAQDDLDTLDREIGKLGEDTGALYDPSALEAADHLAKRTSEALSNLADSSASARRALQGAIDTNKNAKNRAAEAEKLEEAIKKMAAGAMKANPDLREALKDAAAKAMQDLDPDAAQKLQDMLAQNQQKFEDMLDQLVPNEFPGLAPGADGDKEGEQNMPGVGGRQHGDAPPAPLSFHGQERGVDGGKLEALPPAPGAAAPGELLELRAVRPPDPEEAAAPQAAGKPSTEAGGGARLWKENLDPDEQRFLGEFYR